jgi:hypothetical protein
MVVVTLILLFWCAVKPRGIIDLLEQFEGHTGGLKSCVVIFLDESVWVISVEEGF